MIYLGGKMLKRLVVASTFVLYSVTMAGAYKILLLGDSTVNTPYLPVKDQVQSRLKEKLKTLLPDMTIEVVNAGQGGESIGPGAKSNFIEKDIDGYHFFSRYDQVIKESRGVDLVFIRYGSNDKNNYSAGEFKIRLKRLCEMLKRDYPGVKIAVETAMYSDPNHTASKTPNEGTKEVFDAIRAFAKEEGCELGDVYEALKTTTEAGNWDLRIRSDKVTIDDSKDAAHLNDPDKSWWGNIHPNAKGIDIIAALEADIAVKLASKGR